jgi:hypothetical protein
MANSTLDPSSEDMSKLSESYEPSINIPPLASDVQSEEPRSNLNELLVRRGVFYTGTWLIA